MPPAPAVSSRRSGQYSVSARHSRIASPDGGHALLVVALLLRTGVKDHACGADPVAQRQRSLERFERLRAHLVLERGSVDQVDGVDQNGPDARLLDALAELRHCLVRVVLRLPLARALVEDLDRVALELDAASDRVGKPARYGYMRADEHSDRA